MQIENILARAESGQPEAQFLLSQLCLQTGDADGHVRWLRCAYAQGYTDAIDAVGHCHETGLGFAQDFDLALQNYARAIEQGSALACYRKAELLYKSRRGRECEAEIRALLLRAAAADVLPALRAAGYLAVQYQGSQEFGLDCCRRAASLGDAPAAFMLGWCLLNRPGQDGERAAALVALQLAALARYPFADSLLASSGTATLAEVPDFGDARLGEAPAFPLFPEAKPAEHTVLNEDPPIALYSQVLDLVDCAYLIYLSQPRLQPAQVIDPGGDETGQVSGVRTNMETYLPFDSVDMIARYAELKIIRETGETLRDSEPMSILRYAPGQFYRPHVDYFNPRLPVSGKLLEDGGQRRASAITYLTTPAAGGTTSFPRLDLVVPSQAGNTLWFRNCDDAGEIDERSLHAGDPVDAGEKWVVTKWFREGSTSYLPF